MNHLSDELINRYIDKEASGEELSVINEHLTVCDDCASKIKAGRLAESVLTHMDAAYYLSDDFTAKVMSQVVTPASKKAKSSGSFFIKTVFSSFILAIGGVLGYGLSLAVSSAKDSPSQPGELEAIFMGISNFFSSIQLPTISMAQKLPKGMEIVGAAIIITVFTAFYFIYDLHKDLKKRTGQLR